MISKYQFDHIHLYTLEVEKTTQFYQKMFGSFLLAKHDPGDNKVVFLLDLSGVKLLVSTQWYLGDPEGLSHFGIKTDALERTMSEFKRKGVKIKEDITKIRPDLMFSCIEGQENVPIELL